MLLSIIGLVLTIAVIFLIVWSIRWFWAWLGRGKRLQGVCDDDLVSADVKQVVARRCALRRGSGTASRARSSA